MNSQDIPFLDLITPHREMAEQLTSSFRHALSTACFVGGPALDEFEEQFAQFCETRFCIGVASGTDAVRFCLMAAGVGKGDIVVTVSNTFIATTEAISQAEAHPRFVDIDESTYTMSPEKLREYLEIKCHVNATSGVLEERESHLRIAAILPVHLYGQMADMDAILEQAERYGLHVIEDACQAHGAMYFSQRDGNWHKAGSMGLAGAFSFYPGKNLGACGEAGAITTGAPEIARKSRMLRDHGQAEKYYHDVEGYNGRLDAVQAGILCVKLPHLAEWNAGRVEAARRYADLFAAADAPVILPYQPPWSKPVHHLYVIQTDERDALRRALSKAGIGTGIHYPIPLHLQKAYTGLGLTRGTLPVTEDAAGRILSIPMFPTLSGVQQQRVVEAVVGAITHKQGKDAVTV